MADDRSARLESLFAAAQDLPEDEQRRFIDEECGDDADLERELRLLLDHDRSASASSRFLESPVRLAPGAGVGPRAGDVIAGRYTLRSVLGEGGMGTVWLASQDRPQREVAVKLIRLGMDSPEAISRFEAEREMLAALRHPGVATVHDAGVRDDGRPFLVMERVRGEPITEYCAAHRLSVPDRLRLFLLVCDAIQHAHQRGVIHRDLKPSNVLVDTENGAAVPKVIDFGVAKTLTDRPGVAASATMPGQLLGTPQYMSPEQIVPGGRLVDTRTDVYSLGILLYELLTGRPPLDADSFRDSPIDEIRRAVRETDPSVPSSRMSAPEAREVRGDLDWITMKAIEKACDRRYESVGALAADIRRHLRDEPVLAGPPDVRYRAGKFVRRHRALVTGAVVVLLVLGAGIAATTWQARQKALEARTSREVAGFVQEMFSSIDPSVAQGETVTVRDLLDDAARRLEASSISRPVRAELHGTLAATYYNLGVYDAAAAHQRSRLALLEAEHGGAHPKTLNIRGDLALSLSKLGGHADAEVRIRAALDDATAALGPTDRVTLALMIQLAVILDDAGKIDEAGAAYERCHELHVEVLGDGDPSTLTSKSNLGAWYVKTGDYQRAQPLAEAFLEATRRHLGEDHPRTLLARANVALSHANLGDLDTAIAMTSSLVESSARVLGEHHHVTLRRRARLASFLGRTGKVEEAERSLRELRELANEHLGPSDGQAIEVTELLVALIGMSGRLEEAERIALDQHHTLAAELGPRHDQTSRAGFLVWNVYDSWGKEELLAEWTERLKGTRWDPTRGEARQQLDRAPE